LNVREEVHEELVDGGEGVRDLHISTVSMVALGMMVVVKHGRLLGPREQEGQAVTEAVRIRGAPRHLPEDQLDEVPVSINVLLSAEQDGSHVWYIIP